MKPNIKTIEYYLNGGCSVYAVAINELKKFPICVAKIKSPTGLETHIFNYDKKLNKGLDAAGYFSLKPSDFKKIGIVKITKISKSDLLILNKLHLIKITKKEIDKAKRFIKLQEKFQDVQNKKNPLGLIKMLTLFPYSSLKLKGHKPKF